jgi:hypothetical protein
MLEGTTAQLRRGTLSACIDVSRPDWGLRQLNWTGRELPGHLLAVGRWMETSSPDATSAWPLPLADAYVRGDDLVAGYTPADDWPYTPQLYWNATPLPGVDAALASLSLLISVETHLLDTWPRMRVASQLPCQELLAVDPLAGTAHVLQPNETVQPTGPVCCVLQRLTDLPISYVEIMPADDFRELTVRRGPGGKHRAELHLFADFLEKGVIRRARLQTAFLPRENDVQLALQCCAAMERRPLPLTT